MTRYRMSPIEIIIAVDEHGGFGKDGKIPWNHPEDMKHFQEVTKGGVCVMGRKTYEDMLAMRKARDKKKKKKSVIQEILPGRDSYVVTSNKKFKAPGATVVSSLREAVQSLDDDGRTVFVLGGYRMFIEALTWAQTIHLTLIKGVHDCDRFFPVEVLNKAFKIVSGEEADNLYFLQYKRKG